MSKSNSDQLKVYNSPVYRRRIKRMVEMVKTIRGIYTKVPRGGLPKLKSNSTEKEKRLHAEKQSRRLNIESIHYFATPMSGYGGQSSQSQTPESNTEQ